MEEDNYLGLLVPSFHTRYVMPPLNFVPQPPPIPAPQPIIPATGAAKYYYVDPRANQNPVLPQTEQAPRGIGLLPPNAMNILLRNTLGQSPRLADDRSDLLKDTENTFYGGGQAPPPTPTPTPAARKKGASYAI